MNILIEDVTYRRFSDTQEEANEHEVGIVLGKRRAGRYYSPGHHANTHVDRRANLLTGHEHVGRNLHQKVTGTMGQLCHTFVSDARRLPNEEDTDTGIVLRPNKTKVVFEIVESCLCNCISIKIVPKSSHQLLCRVYFEWHVRKVYTYKKYIAHRMVIIRTSSFRTNFISSGSVFATAPE